MVCTYEIVRGCVIYMVNEKLKDFNQQDLHNLNNLIDSLESNETHANGTNLATEIRECLVDGYISSKLKVRITGWCKESTDNRNPTRKIVRDISIIMFGKILTEYD